MRRTITVGIIFLPARMYERESDEHIKVMEIRIHMIEILLITLVCDIFPHSSHSGVS
jgi:hypothetical protein